MSAIKILTATEILNSNDVRIEFVEVPEWSGGVYVREFSAAQREQFDELLTSGVEDTDDEDAIKLNTRNLRARVIALTACNEKGDLLFALEDAELLAVKSDVATARVWDVAARLNKLRRKDRDAEKKESANPPSDVSPTA